MRVVTYNVRGFRDGRDRVAAVARRLRPEVLLLQETGPRRELRRFAASLDLRVARDPRSPFRRRVKNAVLLAEPWWCASHELVRFARSTRWYPRGALIARIRHADEDLEATVISVHLGLDGDERGRQTEEICRLVASLGGAAIVLGGDLNATPDRRATERLASMLRDAWALAGTGDGATFPAGAPLARIDYVFVRGSVDVLAVATGSDAASVSDHLPVVADLRIG